MPANIGIHQIKLGDVVVTALNDGQFEAAAAWVVGIDAAGLETRLHDTFRPYPPRLTVNAYLLEMQGRKVLVDAGVGGKFGPTMGLIGGHLKTLGVSPESIDTILVTHAHSDHVGGLTDDAGAPLFPKAEFVVNAIESKFWLDDGNLANAPDSAKDGFAGARMGLNAYKDRTRLFSDGDEVLPGIKGRLLPGHTAGHSGFQITSGGVSLLIWADIVHLPGLQFETPSIGMAFDADGPLAIETRKSIIEEAARDRLMIGGMHLDFPAFGYVIGNGERSRFEPIVWAPSV